MNENEFINNKNDSQGVILFDSIISLNLATDSREKRYNYYMMRSESLEGNIILKRCNSNSDISLIKESLFLIKHLRERTSDGISLENIEEKKNNQIIYNSLFTLQHYISKKYLMIQKNNSNNNYSLKLVDDDEQAIPFSFKRIVDNKSTHANIYFNQIIYLSVYIKEKSQYYYLNAVSQNTANIVYKLSDHGQRRYTTFQPHTSQDLSIQKYENESTFDIILHADYVNKFMIIDQQHHQSPFNAQIYPGDLINLVYNHSKDKDNSFMIGVKTTNKISSSLYNLKEEEKEDINNFNFDVMNGDFYANKINKIKNNMDVIRNQGKYEICPFNYAQDEYFKHVNFFSFWVIEDDKRSGKKSPISSGDRIRLRNAVLNLYLGVEKKQDGRYSFILVDEDKLYLNSFLFANFQFNHYAINVENQHLTDNGKIIIKALLKDLNQLKESSMNSTVDLNIVYSNFQPISLNVQENNIHIEQNNEFIFELKKIPIQSGNESIYLKSIINQLEIFLVNFALKYQKNSHIIDLIKRNLNFFSNYLLNLEPSFNDPNLEINYPVAYRQNLLMSYDIMEIINKIIKFFSSSSSRKNEPGEKNRTINDQLKELMKQILLFLIYLSENNEEIKKKIYSNMKDILKIGWDLFYDNKSILIFFVLKIVQNCYILQEALLEDKQNVKVFQYLNIQEIERNSKNREVSQQIKTEPINISITLKDLLSNVIESSKYFYFFKKILQFNKSYKNDYIIEELRRILDGNKNRINSKLDGQCEALKEICKNDKDTNRDIYENLIIFLNLLPKFNLYTFLFMKNYFLNHLLYLSDINVESRAKNSPNVRNILENKEDVVLLNNMIVEDDDDEGLFFENESIRNDAKKKKEEEKKDEKKKAIEESKGSSPSKSKIDEKADFAIELYSLFEENKEVDEEEFIHVDNAKLQKHKSGGEKHQDSMKLNADVLRKELEMLKIESKKAESKFSNNVNNNRKGI